MRWRRTQSEHVEDRRGRSIGGGLALGGLGAIGALLGINEGVRREQQRSPDDANELSIRMELQSDCFAGVWGHSAYNDRLLESGDLEEGLEAASAVGDDRIQRSTTGRVDPESWTHGSSEQRMEWFRRGFDTGSVEDCDAFSA